MSHSYQVSVRSSPSLRGRPRTRKTKDNKTRPVVTTSPQRKVGEVNKKWFQDQPVEHESGLEKSCIHSSMMCLGIVRIASQPEKLILGVGAYTPDFELTACTGLQLIVEIKPASKVLRDAEKFNQAAALVREQGKIFYVLTEENLRFHGRDGVAEQLMRYGKSELPAPRLARILECVREAGTIACTDVLARVEATQEDLLHLLARRRLIPRDEGEIGLLTNVCIAPNVDPQEAFEERFNVKPWEYLAPCQVGARGKRGLKKQLKAALPCVGTAGIERLELTPMGIVPGDGQHLSPDREPYIIRRARALAERLEDVVG